MFKALQSWLDPKVADPKLTALRGDDIAGWIATPDAAQRAILFDALLSQKQDLFYSGRDPEKFIVNCQDQYISRNLFVNGIEACEFPKLLLALDILRARSSTPLTFETLVDVGANIGVICIPGVARNHFRQAIAIEPHPVNCQILRANIALNGVHDRIRVCEAAASSVDNVMLELSLSPVNAGDHRISSSRHPGLYDEPEWGSMQVTSLRLDALEGDLAHGSYLIWMDIQGYEGHALAGAKALLKPHPPLVLEFWPYGLARADSFPAMMQAISDYEGFFIIEDNTHFQPIKGLQALWDQLGTGGDFLDILVV